jgi:hypothetical protein
MAIIDSKLVQTYPDDAYHELEYALLAKDLWERQGPDNGYAIANLGNLGAVYAYLAKVKTGLIRDTSALTTYVQLNGKETGPSQA